MRGDHIDFGRCSDIEMLYPLAHDGQYAPWGRWLRQWPKCATQEQVEQIYRLVGLRHVCRNTWRLFRAQFTVEENVD